MKMREKYRLSIRIFFGLLLGIAMGAYYLAVLIIMTIGVVPFCLIYAMYLEVTGKWEVEDVLMPGKIIQKIFHRDID